MKIEQLKDIVNQIQKEVTGKEEIATLDASNVVDIGKEIFDNTSVDNYVKSLVDKVGKTIFVDRKYSGSGINVLMDSWEFGSVLEKIDVELPDAVQNDTWNLIDKQSYSQDTFYKPIVSSKFFNSKTTFEIDVSFTERQVKESFNSMNELNAFVSMIYNSVEKSFTVKLDGLIMATLNNMTAQTLHSDFSDVVGDSYETKSSIKAVNLLYEYKTKFGKTLSVANALTDPDFLKYASVVINSYVDRISKMSTLFNIGGKNRFTPMNDLNLIMLSDFANSEKAYLQADTKNKELVALPNAENVPYWQGTGKDYSFENVSSINVNIKVDNTSKNVKISGILAVLFDKNAVAVCNEDRRVTTHYNAKGEFYNNFFKFDCTYLNDLNENFVVFFINDKAQA